MDRSKGLQSNTVEGKRLKFSEPRVAIIHYWLVGMRGGERVLERLLDIYPQADIFTHVYDPSAVSDKIRSRNVRTTFINSLPKAKSLYQSYLPLMPLALEGLDLNGYDLVISSEAGPSKGIIPAPEALHICYCHSPMRYIWDQYHVYREAAGPVAKIAMPMLAHYLREWDVSSSSRVDHFVVNSRFVGKRVEKYYRRGSTIIYPPVEVDLFSRSATPDYGDTYIWAGQLVPYKAPRLAVEAFNELGLPLTVIGRGSEKKKLQSIAKDNVKFVDSLSFSDLRRAFATARGLVFTAKEDFGILPVEFAAAGRPVLAFSEGGAVETMREGVTGLFFKEQTVECVIDGVERFISWLPSFDPGRSLEHVQKFSSAEFDARFSGHVKGLLEGL